MYISFAEDGEPRVVWVKLRLENLADTSSLKKQENCQKNWKHVFSWAELNLLKTVNWTFYSM
jgi:hypothetical protein